MNKQQYLAARQEWKHDYFELQQQIRNSKQALRRAHNALGRCGSYNYSYKLHDDPETKASNAKWMEAYSEVDKTLQARKAAQKAMSDHLDVLRALKEEARKAWEAREVIAVAA